MDPRESSHGESRQVVVREELLVEAPPEVVWDFTQDFERRAEWDPLVRSARVLDSGPTPRVAIIGPGLRCTFEYKLVRRPERTTLVMADVRSLLVVGGGGSWSYEARQGGTLWTQVNTLRLRRGWTWLGPFTRWSLGWLARRGMRRARRRIRTER